MGPEHLIILTNTMSYTNVGGYNILNKVIILNAPSSACCVILRHKYVQDLRRNIESKA